MFGRIAAANALSDIYAVGAKPLCALNILLFPCAMGAEAARVLTGGADAIRQAGAVILGGHTVDDPQPKYGLAVTGVAQKSQIISHQGAMPGDALILTKKIGTGVLYSAAKSASGPLVKIAGGKKKLSASMAEAVESMARTNQAASEAMIAAGVNACTDITGFGLLGHGRNMAEKSGACLVINASAVPRFDGALELASHGPGGKGMNRNMRWSKPALKQEKEVAASFTRLFCDPQTSGGLLISLPEKKAAGLLAALHKGGDTASAIIGHVEKHTGACVRLVP